VRNLYRSLAVELDRDGNREQQRRQEHNPYRSRETVERRLDENLAKRERPPVNVEQRQSAKFLAVFGGQAKADHVGRETDLDRHLVQLAQDLQQALLGRMRQRDDDPVDLELARQLDKLGRRAVRQLTQTLADGAAAGTIIEHADDVDRFGAGAKPRDQPLRQSARAIDRHRLL